MEEQMTDREKEGRERLKKRKPLVYEKIIKHDEKIRKKESVAFIQLEYDYRCNFRCEHCAIEAFKKPGKGHRKLTVPDVKSIADQADKMGLASICISGGEPLIFPELKDLVDAIDPKRFSVSMDTSGWFLNEEKIKWLVDIGLDRIHLSIDGLEADHDKFRRKEGSWQRCIDALPLCKKHGLGVIVNIVVTKSALKSGELIKQLEFIKGFGCYSSLIYAKPMGGFKGSHDEVLNTEDHNYLDKLTEIYNAGTRHSLVNGYFFKCFTFKKQFSITGYGDVMPCPWIPITFGNFFEEKLESIVSRGLEMEWFSYDYLQDCLCGNTDSFFFQHIMPQVDEIAKINGYPVDWKKINWHREQAKLNPRKEGKK